MPTLIGIAVSVDWSELIPAIPVIWATWAALWVGTIPFALIYHRYYPY